MRLTICEECGKEFLEEHQPENFICDECYDRKEIEEDE